jgi:hypothetical protein
VARTRGPEALIVSEGSKIWVQDHVLGAGESVCIEVQGVRVGRSYVCRGDRETICTGSNQPGMVNTTPSMSMSFPRNASADCKSERRKSVVTSAGVSIRSAGMGLEHGVAIEMPWAWCLFGESALKRQWGRVDMAQAAALALCTHPGCLGVG